MSDYKEIVWSHSKLGCLMCCPMTYFLNYKVKMYPITTKKAFEIGSAVHWGLEHNTDDLTEYFGEKAINYTYDQALSEAMAYGYKFHKDEIFKEVLSDGNGKQLKLLEEIHEIKIYGKLHSYMFPVPHLFLGIIDLLLLVEDEKGEKSFIIIDYKTSSVIPNWSDYLDQIYRYIFLLRSEFPGIPVKKIGIINLRKIKERQRNCETMIEFGKRLKMEYEINDMNNINVHMFEYDKLNKDLVDRYIDNLSMEVDYARTVDNTEAYFINVGALETKYGKSDYYYILTKTPGAHVFYKIEDNVWSDADQKMVTERPCEPSDMLVINKFGKKPIYKYEQFDKLFNSWGESLEDLDLGAFKRALQNEYEITDNLFKTYMLTKLHNEGTKNI